MEKTITNKAVENVISVDEKEIQLWIENDEYKVNVPKDIITTSIIIIILVRNHLSIHLLKTNIFNINILRKSFKI